MANSSISTARFLPESMVVIYDSTLAADAASFDVQNIPQGYKHLLIELSHLGTGAGQQNLLMRFNNDSGANYSGQVITATSGTIAGAGAESTTSMHVGYVYTDTKAGKTVLQVPDYTGSLQKGVIGENSVRLSGGFYWVGSAGNWASASAINRIALFPASGNFAAGSRLTIYGLGGAQLNVEADPVYSIFGSPTTAYEFNTSSLSGLTAMGTPTTENANTTIPDAYYIAQTAAAGVSWKGRYISVTTPFTAITFVKSFAGYTQFNGAGLMVGEATPGAFYVFGPRCSGVHDARIQLSSWTSPTGTGSDLGTALGPTGGYIPVYLAVVASSSDDVDFYCSFNGYSWTRFVLNRDPAYTVGATGICLAAESGTTGASAGFEYLRVWNSALTLPGTG